jgi:hypothetical protein
MFSLLRGAFYSFVDSVFSSKLRPPAAELKPMIINIGRGCLLYAKIGALIVIKRAVTLHMPKEVARIRVSKSSLIIV